jgi:large subunit ribosomal protein L10
MSKVLRHKMVDDLASKLKDLKNMVLVDAQGLTANQATELRATMREGKGRVRLLKNSVALHTFKKLGLGGFEKHLTGMNALVFGPDPVTIAKKLVAYKEKHAGKGGVKAAVIEGKEEGPAAIVDLAKLPSRPELLSQVLGVMQGVTVKFVSTLNEIPRSFVGTLQAIVDKEKK